MFWRDEGDQFWIWDVGAIADGSAEGAEIAASELNAAGIGDIAVFIGSVEIGASVFGDLDDRIVVLAGDAQEEIVEAVRPDFPAEIGENTFGGVERIGACRAFPRARRN